LAIRKRGLPLRAGQPELLFTETRNHTARSFRRKQSVPYVKELHEYVIRGNKEAVNSRANWNKGSPVLTRLNFNPGQLVTLKLRLTDMEPLGGWRLVGKVAEKFSPAKPRAAKAFPALKTLMMDSTEVRDAPKKKTKSFTLQESLKGLRRCKDGRGSRLPDAVVEAVYHYDVQAMVEGNPAGPPQKAGALERPQQDGRHLYNRRNQPCRTNGDYPWYAHGTWFHCIPLVPLVDPCCFYLSRKRYAYP